MENWRKVWRTACGLKHDDGSPWLPDAGLLRLAWALAEDSPALIQGANTIPPPLQAVQDWPVEAACLLGFCGWQGGEGFDTVDEVERFFAEVCTEIDRALGEPAGCRWLLNAWDGTPRAEMRALLLPEVLAALRERGVQAELPQGVA